MSAPTSLPPSASFAARSSIELSAPFVLPEIERSGLTAEAVEGLVTFAVLGLVGVLSGVLRTRAGRQGRRYEVLVTIQRTLADEATLDVSLARLRAALADRLRVDEIAIVARDADRLVVAGGDRGVEGALVGGVRRGGGPVVGAGSGGSGRSRRAFATPLVSG